MKYGMLLLAVFMQKACFGLLPLKGKITEELIDMLMT